MLAKELKTSLTNVAFRENLVGPTLASWNYSLQRMALVQLSQGADEFRWNLHESGKFCVDSMYKDLI
jgi:hypothetical protein